MFFSTTTYQVFGKNLFNFVSLTKIYCHSIYRFDLKSYDFFRAYRYDSHHRRRRVKDISKFLHTWATYTETKNVLSKQNLFLVFNLLDTIFVKIDLKE
jgi:hypothetical protein